MSLAATGAIITYAYNHKTFGQAPGIVTSKKKA
jgi:hypothetical protein